MLLNVGLLLETLAAFLEDVVTSFGMLVSYFRRAGDFFLNGCIFYMLEYRHKNRTS